MPLVERKSLKPLFTHFAIGVELALHHIELAVYFGQSAFRLHQHQTVKPVGNVIGYRGSSAVVDIQPKPAKRNIKALLNRNGRRRAE